MAGKARWSHQTPVPGKRIYERQVVLLRDSTESVHCQGLERCTGGFCHHILPHYFPYRHASKMFVSNPHDPHDLVLCWSEGLRSRGRNASTRDTQPFHWTGVSGGHLVTLGPSCLGVNRQPRGFVLMAMTDPNSQRQVQLLLMIGVRKNMCGVQEMPEDICQHYHTLRLKSKENYNNAVQEGP